MNRKIRLIWTFRGSDAKETAKHHVIHLKEFAAIKNLHFYESSTLEENPFLCAAFIIINELRSGSTHVICKKCMCY